MSNRGWAAESQRPVPKAETAEEKSLRQLFLWV